MPHTPPPYRNDVALPLTEAAQENTFKLPVCAACQTVQYPPREICRRCLSDDLVWQPVSPRGTLLSQVDLHHSLEPYFRDHLPWPTGTVQLENGAVIICHLLNGHMATDSKVDMQAVIDPGGRGVLVAKPRGAKTISWNDVEQGRKS